MIKKSALSVLKYGQRLLKVNNRNSYGALHLRSFAASNVNVAYTYNNKRNSPNTEVYGLSILGALFATTLILAKQSLEQSENCGIVGVIGKSDDAFDFVMEGLTILKNRGYDSAGIATISNSSGDLALTKFASKNSTSDCLDLVQGSKRNHIGHHIGIGHTRWATHGGKTDQNAHPHKDYKDRIAVIHNGTINNFRELRTELQKKGIQFTSETDTEVIAHLTGTYLDEGLNTTEAVSKALARCDGSWGLAVINKACPDEIVIACNGSPLVVGLADEKTYIASETSAFSRYTKNFVALKDGEIGTLHATDNSLDLSRVEKAADSQVLLTPDPYPHFTLKELLEQPEAILRSMSFGARFEGDQVVLGGLDSNAARMLKIENLLITGCGTSKYAAELGAKIMRDLNSFNTVVVTDAAEVRRSDFAPTAGGLLAVSQSGETKDVIRAIKVAEEKDVPIFSVVNSVGSHIARMTGVGCYLNAGREQAVASTKAFTTQVTVLTLIGLWFAQLKQKENKMELLSKVKEKEFTDALHRLPISFGMGVRTRERSKAIAKQLLNSRDLFILGKGYAEPIAFEGALKIKEMCYLHAEGFSGGALKHGPFALIDDSTGDFGPTPLIMIILDDEHGANMRIAAEEVKARGAKVYVITDNESLAKGIDDEPIVIPNNGPLTALTAVLPLQLIAYELAVMKGINPDTPRNLAKAVTTD